jgi:hypothetical protein
LTEVLGLSNDGRVHRDLSLGRRTQVIRNLLDQQRNMVEQFSRGKNRIRIQREQFRKPVQPLRREALALARHPFGDPLRVGGAHGTLHPNHLESQQPASITAPPGQLILKRDFA